MAWQWLKGKCLHLRPEEFVFVMTYFIPYDVFLTLLYLPHVSQKCHSFIRIETLVEPAFSSLTALHRCPCSLPVPFLVIRVFFVFPELILCIPRAPWKPQWPHSWTDRTGSCGESETTGPTLKTHCMCCWEVPWQLFWQVELILVLSQT